MEQAAKRRNAPAKRRRGKAAARDRAFWIALSAAAILHVALIVGAVRSAPRIMGETDGDPDALSVDIVDATSLESTAGPLRESSESAPPPPPPPPPQRAAEARPKETDSPFQFDMTAWEIALRHGRIVRYLVEAMSVVRHHTISKTSHCNKILVR